MKELYRFRQFLTEGVIKENISSHKEEAKRFLEKFVDDNEDKFEFIPDLETGYIDANDNSYNVDELASIFLDIGQDIPRGTHNQKYKGEGGTYVVVSEGVIKEELTWYVEDENEDIRFQNDEYLEEVGKKIKEIHPDISSEDLNKIIIMTGEQYSREEDFHGDSIPSGNFVKAAVEIYQTDVLGSDGDDKDFDRWAPENLDGDFPKDSTFAGWTQAQYDAYQEEPRKYEKYLGGGSFNLAEGVIKEDYKNDYANSEEDFTDEMVVEKIKDIIKYHELDPQDLIDEIRIEFGVDAMD